MLDFNESVIQKAYSWLQENQYISYIFVIGLVIVSVNTDSKDKSRLIN